jgi:hypothetical protein
MNITTPIARRRIYLAGPEVNFRGTFRFGIDKYAQALLRPDAATARSIARA